MHFIVSQILLDSVRVKHFSSFSSVSLKVVPKTVLLGVCLTFLACCVKTSFHGTLMHVAVSVLRRKLYSVTHFTTDIENRSMYPLRSNSDQCQISLLNINAVSVREVMRIKDMISQHEFRS